MTMKLKYNILTILAALSFTACSDFLEPDSESEFVPEACGTDCSSTRHRLVKSISVRYLFSSQMKSLFNGEARLLPTVEVSVEWSISLTIRNSTKVLF